MSSFEFDAFISYRRLDGTRYARRLRHRLLDYRLPASFEEETARKLLVYLDTIYEKADEDFFANTIQPALAGSRHLIVVATPGALAPGPKGGPSWVVREIDYFRALPQGRNVSVALARGEFGDPLPGELGSHFANIEIVDIRALTPLARLWWPADWKVSDEILKFIAQLYDVPRQRMPELRQEEARRKAAATRLYLGIAAVIILLLTGLLAAALWQRSVAEGQREIALSRQLAAQSELLLVQAPRRLDRAVLLALEAFSRDTDRGVRSLEVASALRHSLGLLRRELWSRRHRNWITEVEYSRDGSLLATASADGNACVWAARTGKRITCVAHSGGVTAVALSPSGSSLATGSRDHTGRLWSLPDGKLLATWNAEWDIEDVSFSPDGRLLAVADGAGLVRLIAVPGGEVVRELSHPWGAEKVEFSPGGALFATLSAQDVFVRDTATGALRHTFGQDASIVDMGFSPDGSLLATGGADRSVRLWDLASGAEVARIPSAGTVTALAFHPREPRLALASDNGWIQVFEWLNKAVVASFRHAESVRSIAFSPDGRLLASAAQDGTVRLWDPVLGVENGRLPQADQPVTIAFSPLGGAIASGGSNGEVHVWANRSRGGLDEISYPVFDPTPRRLVLRFAPDGASLAGDVENPGLQIRALDGNADASFGQEAEWSPDGSDLSADGNLAAVAGHRWQPVQFSVRVYDAHRGRKTCELLQDGAARVLFSPDSRRLAVAGQRMSLNGAVVGAGGLMIWDPVTCRPLLSARHRGGVQGMAFSPDGRWLALASATFGIGIEQAPEGESSFRIWDLAQAKEALRVVAASTFQAVDLSGGEQPLAAVGWSRGVDLWDISRRELMTRLRFAQPVTAVAFSPGGELFAAGGRDGAVRVWDVRRRRERAHFSHDEGVTSLTFGRGGSLLITGSRDRTVRIWDLTAGREVDRLQHGGEVLAVALSPDERHLAALYVDSFMASSPWARALMWRLDPHDLIAATCRNLGTDLTREEWALYLPGQPYRQTCRDLLKPGW
jgi:WD40 repeat protein